MNTLKFDFNGISYIIEKATPVKRKIGRPRMKMATYSLVVRRPYGSQRFASFLYYDGSFCQPF